MNRGWWVAVVALGLFAACGRKPRPGRPPAHVLLITVENMRADHVTHLGHERRTTALLRPDQPIVLDMDSVALTGVAFPNAYASAAEPKFSLASLMGNGYPMKEGRAAVSTAFESGSLAQAFRDEGYVTACFVSGRSLDPTDSTEANFAKGFQKASFEGSDQETLAAAVSWSQTEYPKGGKHFTWIHLADIQAPFTGEPFVDRHSVELPEGVNLPDPQELVSRLQSAGVRPSSSDRAHLNDFYDGQFVRTSELVNSFYFLYRNEFGVEGLWDDTVVVVAGATGCELGEADGGIGDHNSLREEALRVPILFTHRGSLTGERIFGEVVELQDLGACLRDWFRVDPGANSAHSLLAITDSYVEREFAARPALSFESGAGDYSLRTERYRLEHAGGEVRLFDLQVDPAGVIDISTESPAVVSRIQAAAADRLEQLGLKP